MLKRKEVYNNIMVLTIIIMCRIKGEINEVPCVQGHNYVFVYVYTFVYIHVYNIRIVNVRDCNFSLDSAQRSQS